jgi:hypothetical protein
MGIARSFDGVKTNFITTDPSDAYAATNKITFAGWAKVTDNSLERNFTGKISGIGGGGGARFSISTGGTLFIVTNVSFAGSSVAVSGFLNNWKFVAVTLDGATGECKFYSGASAESITQLGTTQVFFTTLAGTGTAMDLGRNAQTGVELPFKGELDQWGVWRQVLTLAQLKTHAMCGTAVLSGDAIYLLPITGASPEPNLSTLTSQQGNINGTVPVTTGITGCDISAVGGVARVGNLSKVPPISGGTGGGYTGCCGLGYNVSAGFGGGEEVGIVPGSQHEPPDFGKSDQTPKLGSLEGRSKQHPYAWKGSKGLLDYAQQRRNK